MFFERKQGGERALLVHPTGMNDRKGESIEEFTELVRSAQADPVAVVIVQNRKVTPRYFIGTGKLEEIAEQIAAEQIDVVLFDHALSPRQEKNLESALKCRVVDRTGLILDIFAQRAQTHEGKLQVELAQLEHISGRLVRGWTHLERQKGGIGLRGPGETQLETDRRLLRIRIKTIRQRLEKVKKQRALTRRARQRAEVPMVALAGYTNAGKSTLFNVLTSSDAYVADQLFATLDPTVRRLQLPDLGPVVLADTVGFIRNLPHHLVQAFRATLEELTKADLLVQVIDCADPERATTIEQVHSVLSDIDAYDIPRLEVYNKVDLLPDVEPRVDRDQYNRPYRVWISAQSGEGLDVLARVIADRLGEEITHEALVVPPLHGRLRSRLYDMGVVQHEYVNPEGEVVVEVRMPRRELERLCGGAAMLAKQRVAPKKAS